ncbi:MAG: HNH endonuclease [Polyangiales bacterium]
MPKPRAPDADARPPIPEPLRRAVLVEAGHRCAIPTCRQIPVDVHHITDFAKVREHTFDNLIVLCANCHRRCGSGDDIDRKSVLAYKRNLGLLHGRYSDIERRALEEFGRSMLAGTFQPDQFILTPKHMRIFFHYLIADGLLHDCSPWDYEDREHYGLTEQGREFVRRWVGAEALE